MCLYPSAKYIPLGRHVNIMMIGGLELFYIFPSIGNVIIPTDELHHVSVG